MKFYFLPKNTMIRFATIVTTVFLTAYSASSAVVSPIESRQSLDGVWKITRYVFDGMSAMNKAEASQWIGRIATIKANIITFEFSKIAKYKTMFADVSSCTISNSSDPKRGKTTELYDALQPTDIKADSAWLYSSSCKYTPFQSFAVTDNNELIMRWDGVIFILQRISIPAAIKQGKPKKPTKALPKAK